MTAKIGLIGLGNFARRNIIPGIQRTRGLELAAIFDQSPIALRAVAEGLPSATACASADELIARRDLDLIYIATPSAAHVELVEAVIAAGRHVVCEKPFATTYAEAARLADLAKKAGLVTAVDHEMRYSAIYRGMKRRLDEGYVGNVVLASVNFGTDYSTNPYYPATYYWNFGSIRAHTGGVMRQAISHFIDLYQFLFGSIEPRGGYCSTMIKSKPEALESVSAAGERVISPGAMRPVDADDAIALAGSLPNGAPASIAATWSAAMTTGTRWMIQGDAGVLSYEGAVLGGLWGDQLQGARRGEALADLELPAESFPDMRPTAPGYMGGLIAAQLEDVLAVIGTGAEGMFATFESECAVWKAMESWDR